MRTTAITCFFLMAAFWLKASAQLPALQKAYSLARIEGIKLNNLDDKPVAVGIESPLTLFVFLSPECPLSQGYTATLNKIDSQFTASVAVVGIIPGRVYPASDVKTFVNNYRISFPVYIDQAMELTRLINGTITPEAVLINQQGLVVYRGAIDDWAAAPGKKKLVVSNEYLKNAIRNYLDKQPVLLATVKPVGCLINEY